MKRYRGIVSNGDTRQKYDENRLNSVDAETSHNNHSIFSTHTARFTYNELKKQVRMYYRSGTVALTALGWLAGSRLI